MRRSGSVHSISTGDGGGSFASSSPSFGSSPAGAPASPPPFFAFSRAAFLHHALGWTALVGAVITLGLCLRPRSPVFNAGFALVFLAFATLLFCDRNVAPIFGHLSPLAGAK